MAEQFHTLAELNEVFQEAVLKILGYTKSGSPEEYSDAAYYAVRITNQTEGQPAWEVGEDVVFVRCLEEDERINREREEENADYLDNLLTSVSYTRVIGLYLSIYGPNSFDNAQSIRDGFFNDSQREFLTRGHLYIVPDVVSPRRVPELWVGQWWERVDFNVRFNEHICKETETNRIVSADIQVITDVSVD